MTLLGSHRKILHVDLSASQIWEEMLDPELYRLFPGGKALAAYLLLRDLPPHALQPDADPLGPENVLVLAAGLLTGAPVATATRFTAAARSPLTGGIGLSEAGGFWGPELKLAGYEAIEITGRAPHPVYLALIGDRPALRDARGLWGREPEFVQAQIRRELGDERARVLQTGVAGENLVRFAALTHEMRHYNGRTGIGAVMGSKNLKACAVRSAGGRYASLAADPAALAEIGKRLSKEATTHPLSRDLHDKGTISLLAGFNAAGMLPTRNFRQGRFEGAEQVDHTAVQGAILAEPHSCYACAVRCKPAYRADQPYGLDPQVGGPEYEGQAGFSSDCGVSDLGAMAKANELCNRFVLDTISAAGTIAFAMECFENGLLGPEDTGGLDLRFGNAGAMLQMIEWIARCQGIGDLLAEGSRRAAQKIGGGALAYALQVKGQELPMHEARGKVGVGLGYAVSETGADHLVSIHDTMLQNPESIPFKGAQALGIRDALPARQLDAAKAANYFLCENWVSAGNTLGLCYFGPAPRSFIQPVDVIAAVQAASGWDVDLAELLDIGERATNLARLFNARVGLSRADDDLPARLFQPLENGALAGVSYPRPEFEAALTELYRLKGWDVQTGHPTPEQLDALGVGFLKEWLP